LNQKERITELQLAVLIAAGFVELGLYSFPRDLSGISGRQHLFSLGLLLVIGLATVWVLAYFSLYFGGRSAVEAIFHVVGRPLGLVMTIPAIAFHLFLGAVCLRYFADFTNTFFLPKTPPEAIMLLIILAVIFVVGQGFAAGARLAVAMVPAFFVLVLVAYLLVGSKITEWGAVFPSTDLWPPNFLAGTSRIIYLVVGLETIPFFLPLVGKLNRPYLWVTLPMVANGVLLLVISVVTFGVLGLEPTGLLQYPGATALRTLRMPGLLVERTGALIALAWTVLKVGYLGVRVTTSGMAICTCFGMSVSRYRSFLLPLAVIVFYMARWPADTEELEHLLTSWIGTAGLVMNLGYALFLLLIGWARGKGVRST